MNLFNSTSTIKFTCFCDTDKSIPSCLFIRCYPFDPICSSFANSISSFPEPSFYLFANAVWRSWCEINRLCSVGNSKQTQSRSLFDKIIFLLLSKLLGSVNLLSLDRKNIWKEKKVFFNNLFLYLESRRQ